MCDNNSPLARSLARCTPLSSLNLEHLNLHSLAWYFAQKAMPSGSTIDQRISELPPGCMLEYTLADKSLSIRSYYDIRELLSHDMSSSVDDVHEHSEDAAAIPPAHPSESPLFPTRESETLSGRSGGAADTEIVDELERLLLESVRMKSISTGDSRQNSISTCWIDSRTSPTANSLFPCVTVSALMSVQCTQFQQMN